MKSTVTISIDYGLVSDLRKEGVTNFSAWVESKINEELKNSLIRQCPECGCAARLSAWRRWNWVCGGDDYVHNQKVGCGKNFSEERPSLLEVRE